MDYFFDWVLWTVSIAIKNGVDFGFFQHLFGLASSEWGYSRGCVFVYLGVYAAGAHNDYGAKEGISFHAEEKFDPFGELFLDEDGGLVVVFGDERELSVGVFDVFFAREIGNDCSFFCFVDNCWRRNF